MDGRLVTPAIRERFRRNMEEGKRCAYGECDYPLSRLVMACNLNHKAKWQEISRARKSQVPEKLQT